eukprot:m.353953 g.353953  ORF g.353953 m.353953 type:complete len:270 (-) comp16870_c0_seq1:269-1078(-)
MSWEDAEWDAVDVEEAAVEDWETADYLDEAGAEEEPAEGVGAQPSKKHQNMTREELLAEVAELTRLLNTGGIQKKKTPKYEKKLEEERRAKELEAERQLAEAEANLSREELAAKKLAEKRAREDAQLQDLGDFLGEQQEEVVLIEAMHPATKEEFDKLQAAIVKKVSKYDASPHYVDCLKAMFTGLCDTEALKAETVKDIIKPLNVIASQKIKDRTKEKSKKKSKKKSTAQLGRLGARDALLDDYGDEDFEEAAPPSTSAANEDDFDFM